ncbi:hypothetical protein MBLNU457_6136t3 [Dothideomycetes sp. NU457]
MSDPHHNPRLLGFWLNFLLLFSARYTRLIVNIVAFLLFRARKVARNPRFLPKDVAVIMSTTFGKPEEHAKTLLRIAANLPGQMIISTADHKVAEINDFLKGHDLDNVEVVGVKAFNKRIQMLNALKRVTPPITVFVDDDVDWQHDSFLTNLLAGFEDPLVGAVGPRQRTFRMDKPTMWNFLGISYLERRNFNTGATNYIDGGISTLSGRTQAVRTSILKSKHFFNYFQTDSFLGRPLLVDDDKCLTRYLYSQGWRIALNFSDLCTIETTQETDRKFIDQCIRWARGHWRGNLIVMSKETYWFKSHIWTLYAVYISQFQTPALLVDGILVYALYCALNPGTSTGESWSPYSGTTRVVAYLVFALWVFFTKLVKLIPHFVRHPADLKFIPVSIVFSYAHGLINIYALLTTYKTVWGGKNLHGGATGEDAPLLSPDLDEDNNSDADDDGSIKLVDDDDNTNDSDSS